MMRKGCGGWGKRQKREGNREREKGKGKREKGKGKKGKGKREKGKGRGWKWTNQCRKKESRRPTRSMVAAPGNQHLHLARGLAAHKGNQGRLGAVSLAGRVEDLGSALCHSLWALVFETACSLCRKGTTLPKLPCRTCAAQLAPLFPLQQQGPRHGPFRSHGLCSWNQSQTTAERAPTPQPPSPPHHTTSTTTTTSP